MGLFNVPQFIDIEDKIVGPLTAKQLGWMGAAGVILLVAWSILDLTAFIIAAILTSVIFGSLAFYRPNGQPLVYFIFSAISFAFRPKIYIWKRVADKSVLGFTPAQKTKAEKNAKIKTLAPKEFSERKIEDISHLLDSK
ncbi:MAG: PrgI family protein [Candidatus Moranbacteria bacterium]|nr:PrgI family protein [Candidatus Moranbacteria bacterium]